MKKIALTYRGRRMIGDSLLQEFEKLDGETVTVSGIKGVWIGYRYEAEHNGKNISMKIRPPQIGDAEHVQADTWRAIEAAAITENTKRKLRARADKNKALLDDVVNIRRFTKGLKFSEIASFCEWLVDRVTAEERQKLVADFNSCIKRTLRKIEKRDK